MYITLYILSYIITYYYCKWTDIKAFGENERTWSVIFMHLIISLFTLLTIISQTIVYWEYICPKITLPKPPKWL